MLLSSPHSLQRQSQVANRSMSDHNGDHYGAPFFFPLHIVAYIQLLFGSLSANLPARSNINRDVALHVHYRRHICGCRGTLIP
jgi:hypothetical protein